MPHDALNDTLLLLAVSVVAVALFRRIKLPAILAYLSVGAILGPYALGVMTDSEGVRFLAEVGVAFLLFSLGLEFSLPRLIADRKAVLGLGSAQVSITILVSFLAAWALGASVETAFVVGCVLALSSTAIVIKQLSERLEIDSRHGRLSVAILLYQDIAVIPMLVIIPALGGTNGEPFLQQLVISFAEGIAVGAVMLAIGHWFLRPLFHEIAAAHSSELFTLAVLMVALTSAWATHHAGMSMALGAFMAGMMLSETEFRHQIEADIRPFRDILLGLFFITVGMLLDLASLPAIIHWVLLITLAIILGKTLATMAMGMLITRMPKGVALRTGLVLAQGGEFGFALLSLAIASGVMHKELSQMLLASVVFSMIATPFLIRYNGAITKQLLKGSYGEARRKMEDDIKASAASLDHHVIICGFGHIGQNIARVLDEEHIEYFALDYDIRLLQNARKAHYRVFFGDSTHREILEAAGIQRASAIVICHEDLATVERTLEEAKKLNPDVVVLLRTRDETHLEELQQKGATAIVPEALEAGLMMSSRLLTLLEVPPPRVEQLVQTLREDNYTSLRQYFHGEDHIDLGDTDESRKRLNSVTLVPGAHAIGKHLKDLDLDTINVKLQSCHRGDSEPMDTNVNIQLKQGDVLVLSGTPEDLEHAEGLLLNG